MRMDEYMYMCTLNSDSTYVFGIMMSCSQTSVHVCIMSIHCNASVGLDDHIILLIHAGADASWVFLCSRTVPLYSPGGSPQYSLHLSGG